jgi:hypothetical protein
MRYDNENQESGVRSQNTEPVRAYSYTRQRNREPRTENCGTSIQESGDRIQGNVLPTHDPTEDATRFDEETRWV